MKRHKSDDRIKFPQIEKCIHHFKFSKTKPQAHNMIEGTTSTELNHHLNFNKIYLYISPVKGISPVKVKGC